VVFMPVCPGIVFGVIGAQSLNSGSAWTVLAPLLLALLAAPAAALAGSFRAGWAARVGAAFAAAAFGATLWGWSAGGGAVDLPWAPTLDLRIALSLDGLAALYSLLATGIGALVLVYSSRYVPLHLEHQRRPRREETRFYAFLLLFMGSMVGLAMSQDLILFFVFWDLTAIASYYLIGYDRHEASSRRSALMAFLVTGVSAVFFLIGALMLHARYGSFSLPELIARAVPDATLTVAGALLAVAGLAKSAQVPLHFWLPRAMAAPTPVSAYLHSAAMVAAGVLLLGRFYPLLQRSELLLDGLFVVGALSMTVGGVLALTRDVLKQVLAYSTISQYGYVVVLYGLGGKYGAVGASFYVLAHGLAKSALFLTAGAVTEATGETRLSRLGGLASRMPVLALGSAVAAAGIAALPITAGFFKDELFFAAALERGWGYAVFAVGGAGLTFAYMARFWSGVFIGHRRAEPHPVTTRLVAPVALLGLLVVAGGIVVGPFERVAEAAGSVSYGEPAQVSLAYHLDARPENLMALAAYALGGLLLFLRPAWVGAAEALSRLGERLGPERGYTLALRGLNRLSDSIHTVEVRDLRSRVATILVPCALLVGAGLLATPFEGAYAVGAVELADLPLILVLVLAAGAAIATTRPTNHLTLSLVLSGVGYSLAVVYAFFGGPNVALVAVLIETVLVLLFLGVLSLLPREVLEHRELEPEGGSRRWRDPLVGVVAGVFAFVVVWGVLSRSTPVESVAFDQTRLTPDAHAKDVVTAILADFRGLDTFGEITVLTITLLGIATLIQGGRLWVRRS
jgi:multicomponent Na+:H+ antiporter subunit A